MSKKYDDYVNNVKKHGDNYMKYLFEKTVCPMIPEIDDELTRELRDRAIIALVKKSVSKGIDLTYGDIRIIVDNDSSEKEYEFEKANQKVR